MSKNLLTESPGFATSVISQIRFCIFIRLRKKYVNTFKIKSDLLIKRERGQERMGSNSSLKEYYSAMPECNQLFIQMIVSNCYRAKNGQA